MIVPLHIISIPFVKLTFLNGRTHSYEYNKIQSDRNLLGNTLRFLGRYSILVIVHENIFIEISGKMKLT